MLGNVTPIASSTARPRDSSKSIILAAHMNRHWNSLTEMHLRYTAGAALHCWPKVQDGLSQVHRVLKPGGSFFATTFCKWRSTDQHLVHRTTRFVCMYVRISMFYVWFLMMCISVSIREFSSACECLHVHMCWMLSIYDPFAWFVQSFCIRMHNVYLWYHSSTFFDNLIYRGLDMYTVLHIVPHPFQIPNVVSSAKRPPEYVKNRDQNFKKLVLLILTIMTPAVWGIPDEVVNLSENCETLFDKAHACFESAYESYVKIAWYDTFVRQIPRVSGHVVLCAILPGKWFKTVVRPPWHEWMFQKSLLL